MEKLLQKNIYSAKIELLIYLNEAYGSPIYHTYSSYNELSFLLFLFSLKELGYFTNNCTNRNAMYKVPLSEKEKKDR